MLNRDRLFDEMGGIRDAYILSAADLLGYEKEDKLMHLPQTARVRKMTRAILIAAAITALLAATAYAAFFAFSYRVPEQSETFRISWVENPGGYIEWSDAKLAVTFPDTAVSQKIEFRPGWLPFELPQRLDLSAPGDALTADTWFTRLTAESLCWQAGPNYIPEYSGYTQPLEIKTYSMAEFNDGGALLMLYQTPGEIAGEHWDGQDVDVLRFCGSQVMEARPEFDATERTLKYNYAVLSNARSGWIVVVAGQLDMDTITRVAKNLEIRETGETAAYEDFPDHYAFFDGSVG